MAHSLYKWTGPLVQPASFDGDEAPAWYGTDENGVSYAFLTSAYAGACTVENDDLAVTTASAAKTWVKENSKQAMAIDAECVEEIRKKYTVDQEFAAHRTSNTTVLNDIGAIVTAHQALKDALVGD